MFFAIKIRLRCLFASLFLFLCNVKYRIIMNKRPIIGYYGYWVALTYFSVVSAIVGMLFALNGYVSYAIICLMISGVCDMFDGPVARLKKRTEREENYGIQIDAFADIISFGVFPAVIGYSLQTKLEYSLFSSEMIVNIIILCVYVLSALIRLSYFNVIEIELQNKKEKRKYYEGMPVTFAAIIIPSVYVVCLAFDIQFSSIYNIMLIILSIAFVIRVKIPKFRGKQLIIFILIGLPIAAYLIWRIGVKY